MATANDPYREFASSYQRFFAGFGVHDPAYETFFRTLFERHGVRRVLDCACGVGQDMHLFHTLGCEVYGSDLSEAMLAEARRNLAAAGLELPLTQADFRELPTHFDRRFDAVVCLSTSLPHLLEDAELLRALRSLRAVLREGGVLVLTQGMCDRQLREKPRFIPVIQTRDFSRVFVIDYGTETLTIHALDLVHEEARQDFQTYDFTYRILLRDDYDRLLSAAGYGERWFYGGYGLEPYDKERSHRLIVVAQR